MDSSNGEDIAANACAITGNSAYVNSNIEEECIEDGCGTSASNPFKTIDWALQMIMPSQTNQTIIYLANGTYSPETGETFPIILPSYVNLQCEDEEARSVFNRLRFLLGNINNILCIEAPLHSDILKVAGTADCIAEYNNELAIIDFKTSKKPKPREWIEHYFVQAMAYGCMLYEMKGISIKKLVIIMACENGECVVYEEYDKSKYIKLLGEYIRKFVGDKLELYGT